MFVGDHEYDKFVELSLKYLGYETKLLDENGKQKRDFITLNDKYLVYVSRYYLTLGEIDNACKTAKENNKSLTVILNNGYITSEAYTVVNQGGINMYDRDDLYNALHKAIETKGGKPLRECLFT